VSINDFVLPDTDVVALVGRILGFVASHEAGHYLGAFHTKPIAFGLSSKPSHWRWTPRPSV
jgi:hypothetical protein